MSSEIASFCRLEREKKIDFYSPKISRDFTTNLEDQIMIVSFELISQKLLNCDAWCRSFLLGGSREVMMEFCFEADPS